MKDKGLDIATPIDVRPQYNGILVTAMGFKSQVGPSFGNNFDTRAEESIRSAHDFWAVHRERAVGDIPRPFLGWLMLVEDALSPRSPVSEATPHTRIFLEF